MAGIPHRFNYSLHDTDCRLEADHAAFMAYARRRLLDLLDTGGEPEPGSLPGVTARLHWNAAPSPAWKSRQTVQWGRRLQQSGERILLAEIQPLPGLQLEVQWAGNALVVEAFFRTESTLAGLAQGLGRGRDRLFGALLYYLVYFPCIHFLEQQRGWHLLHAGAVANRGGAWLLAGLPGSGKTTFCLSLLADPEARLVSDNLVLFDQQKIYACPESIHLSRESYDLLPGRAKELLAEAGREFSYNRRERILSHEARLRQASPQALCFTGLAGELERRPVSPETAAGRLWAYDQQAREIQAYAQFAAACEMIAPHPGSLARKYNDLEALVSGLECYELLLNRGADLAPALQLTNQAFEEPVQNRIVSAK